MRVEREGKKVNFKLSGGKEVEGGKKKGGQLKQ
jgi:hypothetical protein